MQASVQSCESASATSVALALAESVLKPLLGTFKGKLSSLRQGDNALSFEITAVPRGFKPQGCKVISSVDATCCSSAEEKNAFYLCDVRGTLVRLSTYEQETCRELRVMGAIYTGPDRDQALKQALTTARRMGA